MMKTKRNEPRFFPVLVLVALLLNTGFAVDQPGPPSITLDAQIRAEVIEGAIKALNEAYVFPEVAKKMEQAIRARVAHKEYDSLNDAGAFARALTAHLQEISHDKHLRVIPSAGSRFAAAPPQQREMAVKRNFGFEKVERLSGNVGYLDLRGFEQGQDANQTASAAMNFLANTDALIVDLRQNGGGSPAMVAWLSSYLFDKRTHLNTIHNRPNNSSQEFWTEETVPGKRYGNKPVYVLTSQYTFSAAEEFTYNLQSLNRATIVGETTGGGAHPVQPRQLGKHFLVTVPFARSVNPITKTNWEGTGVKPEIAVAADKALKVAHLAALKRTQPNVTDSQFAAQLKTLIESLQQEVGDVTLPASAQTAKPQTAPAPAPSQTTETKLPETPVGKMLGKFLLAFNTGKIEAMKQFHKETGGDEGNAEQDFGFYQQSGGLTVQRVVESSDYEIKVLVQTKKDGRWLHFGIGIERQAPHGIADIRVQPAQPPSDKPGEQQQASAPQPQTKSGKRNDADLVKETNTLLDKDNAGDQFSGVVLIAKNNQPILHRAVGLANRKDNTPNRNDTKFNLGSINKIFTQIAVLQLAEAGKLSLDDTIGKHLPAYPNKQAAEKATIRHLINMQSGIGDFFGPKFQATPKNQIRTINDYLKLFADEPLKFEPGTSRNYSNGGYVVLGAIIEKVTGQSYYEYVREHVFKPAGMTDTESYESDANVPNLAQGYTRRSEGGDKWVNNVQTRPGRGSSAGGGYSTANDLLKFTIALQNNKLLNAENSRKIGGGLGIAGGAPGINAALEFDARSGYTIIVLSNLDPPSAENLAEQIRKSLGL